MDKITTISKNRILADSVNYAILRQKGIDYIQQLSSKIWTDYNYHDPGITILEVLCYALTECGYRSNFDIADLITREPGNSNKDFYTAREILTINPTTIEDLKKFIIDQDGIKNCWLYKCKYDDTTTEPMTDRPAFYYQCEGLTKAYDIKMFPDGVFQPKYLNGLYNVVLELEEDDVLGDLNANVIEWQTNTYLLKVVSPIIEITYPAWDYPVNNILSYSNITSAVATVTGNGDIRTLDSYKLIFDGDSAKAITFTNLKIIVTDTDGTNTLPDNTTIANELVNILSSKQWFGEVISDKYKKILIVIREVYCALQRTRNLCEDYVKFSIVPQQEILLCTDVETTPTADLAEVLAEIYYRVDAFLSPEVKFYNLLEMYDKGIATEQIFDGPALNHGFIIDDELDTCELKTEVHTSDLYNIIMAIPGVTAIKYLQITNFLNGIAQTTGEFWCLKLGGAYSLHLKKQSEQQIHFYKNGLLFFADTNEADLIIKTLEAENSKPKLLNTANDLPIPAGTYKNLSEYYSIQNDFPDVYKTGRNGITKKDSQLRIAQTKQLKAFLLFFDQVLIDFFGQLKLAKNLLSVNTSLTLHHTYASLPVYDTPETIAAPDFYHVRNLIKDFTKALPSSVDLDDEKTYQPQWNNFIADNNNDFLKALKKITEDKDLFYQRRNMFLDHLIARFAESFGDYVTLMNEMFGETSEQSVIDDKINFIKDYPKLSSERGKAFQYACCTENNVLINGWPLDNISGFQRRVSRLLGIDYATDRQLVPIGLSSTLATGFNINTLDNSFQFVVNNVVELENPSPDFSSIEEAETAVCTALVLAGNANNYKINEVDFSFTLQDKNGNIFAEHNTPSANEDDAKTLIASIVAAVKQFYFTEGFHVIEHILLRPVINRNVSETDIDAGYFPLCRLTDDCDCPITDQYSFRLTVVMPYWPSRFQSMNFRMYAERLMQYEAPAHILLRICWVSAADMYLFEYYYQQWLQLKCALLPDRKDMDDATTMLIEKINNLTNIYPEGVLHNCDVPSDQPSIILGQSALGTIAPDDADSKE